MSNSCAIYPRLKKSGEISPLFKSLKEFFGNRDQAVKYYGKIMSSQFKELFPKVKYNKDTEEPVFTDVVKQCGLNKLLDEQSTLDRLNKQYSDEQQNNYSGVMSLLGQATDFNNGIFNNDYAAKIIFDNEKASLIIVPKRDINPNELKKMEENYKINTRLEQLLENWGIGIGALDGLEERMGIGGKVDFSVAKNAATGIRDIIKLSKGIEGVKALPEEFAHFVVDAVGEIPLKERLLNTLNNEEVLKNILGENYDKYNSLYNNNTELLAEEALGKLVAQVLKNEQPKVASQSLFNRFINQVKSFFSSKDESQIDTIIDNVMQDVYQLTKGILDNTIKLNTSKPAYKKRLYNLSENIERDNKLIKSIRATELKRLNIYKRNEDFSERQKNLISQLEESMAQNKQLDAVYTYMNNSIGTLKALSDRMSNIASLTTREKFDTLRNIRDYIQSYGVIMKEIREQIYAAKRLGDNRYYEKLKLLLNENLSLIGELNSDFYDIARSEFAEFIRPFVGDNLTLSIGKNKGKSYTAEQLIDSMDRDITVFDRWIDSMADSRDPILNIYGQIVNKQKHLARLDTIKIEKDIMAKTLALEKAGFKDTSFMYSKIDGVLTGFFISEDSEEYKNLHDAQKDYYNYIINLKAELDAVLPHSSALLAPQIRRDFIDRMKQSTNKAKYFWETMKDNLVRREDETDLFSKSTLMDFEGNEFMSLPIYYTHKLKDTNDLSTDVASTMIAYASMVNDYNRMNEVIDSLEVGRILLRQRKVTQTEGNKSKKETIESLGRSIEKLLSKQGDSTLFMQKLNDFMTGHVYGRMKKDEGTTWGIDNAKAADFLNKMTSYSTTALSLLTGAANLMQNITLSSIEAFANRYFNKSELFFADKEYSKEILPYIGELGNRVKKSKLALFDELFDVNQDYKQHVRSIDFNKKTWFTRLAKEDALFFATTAGDHYTQNRIAIALAKRYKMLDNKGNETNLWDSLKVVEVNGKYFLDIKEGYRKLDGTEFSDEDTILMTNRIRATQERLYGIYNDYDKNMVQQRALGRLAMLYRNWMRPLFLNRFGEARYNYDLGQETEGYYRTLGRFTYNLIKEMKNSEFHIIQDFKNLTPLEKSNIKRGFAELATYGALLLLIQALHFIPEDDKKRPWAVRLASYSALRLKTDMGVLLPSYTMMDEGLKFFESPFAAMTAMKRIRNTFNLIYPSEWTTEIDRGMYKGYTKAEKDLIDLLPFRKPIVNALEPDEPAKWYK